MRVSDQKRREVIPINRLILILLKDINEVIVFKNKDLDAKLISNAFVNPLTALCLKEKLSKMSD